MYIYGNVIPMRAEIVMRVCERFFDDPIHLPITPCHVDMVWQTNKIKWKMNIFTFRSVRSRVVFLYSI